MKRNEKWDEPTGPLTEEEMTNWARLINIKKLIEGRISGDTSERAWRELDAYKSMKRMIVDVSDIGLLYEFEDSRQIITTGFPLVPLGFTLKPGMRFMILAADVTPKKSDKPKKKPKARKKRKK